MIGRAIGFVVRRGFRMGMYVSALVAGGLIAYGVFSESVRGSGKSATEVRKLGDISEVVITRGDTIEIVQGDVPTVRVTADDNILPLLETRQIKKKLVFATKSDFSIHPVTPISYAVTVPQLEKISIRGVGNVQAKGLAGDALTIDLSGAGSAKLSNISCKTLNLTLSGAGKTTLSGSVEKLVIKLSGAGDVDAQDLKAATADVHISGAGTAKMWATTELKAKISGAGSIQYRGTPKIEQKISGAGSVKPIGG